MKLKFTPVKMKVNFSVREIVNQSVDVTVWHSTWYLSHHAIRGVTQVVQMGVYHNET